MVFDGLHRAERPVDDLVLRLGDNALLLGGAVRESLVTVWVVVLTPSARAVVVAVTVFTTSRTVSMVWLTVRLPSAAMVSTVLMSLSTPSTIWRLVEVMTCFCWVVPLDSVSVTVSVVVVTPFLTAVVVSLMDLTMSAVACFVLFGGRGGRSGRSGGRCRRARKSRNCGPRQLETVRPAHCACRGGSGLPYLFSTADSCR